ncbi:MAG: hypothetical protein OIF47_07455 [Marinibacterium sp.]|nr:hypothetical protein [Marinibacterium sp.]
MARATDGGQDRVVRIHAPDVLVETGLMRHILPRFSLKTGQRVVLVDDPAGADLRLGAQGAPLFQGMGQVWALEIATPDDPGTARLVGWLTGTVGTRTILGFAPDGTVLFQPPDRVEVAKAPVRIDGDAKAGHTISRVKCGRCHAVDAAGRKTDIGSTPSFFVLRSLPDWDQRFAAFYALNPHPAFTQVPEVTPPFPIDRPSPIVPIAITLDELEAVMAYVAVIDAADLGAPLAHQ